MDGSYTVKLLIYETAPKGKVEAKFYETGYSSIQPLNNNIQHKKAFKEAIANAKMKYAYHAQKKYEDIEINYELLDTYVTYYKQDRKTKKRWKTQQKTPLTPNEKRKLHKESLTEHQTNVNKYKSIREDTPISQSEYTKETSTKKTIKKRGKPMTSQKRPYKSVEAYRKEKKETKNRKIKR